MLNITGALRVFVAVEPVDLRKSYNGLYDITERVLQENPCSGALFVFTNRRRNIIKMLYFDGTGLWVMMKKLEKGTFSWPNSEGKAKLHLAPEALQLLLDGIDLRQGGMRPWCQR